MDFHCLARKELQFLCKKNKIPANITNVSMAEALKALELVEGLEELQSQSQSPEKTVNKEIPPTGTVTRTSTRRKPSKDEHQNTRSTIRTQKTTRKTMGVEEENKSLNVPVIEVKDQKKSGMVETPLPSGRRRPGVGSTRSKVEGARRSVRLLEKCMTGLSIKESEEKPVKVDEMVECEVGSNNSQSGATSELPLARNLSASLEDEREFSDGVEETSKCDNGESNERTDELEGSDGNAVSQDSINDGNLNDEPVVDETKSFEVPVANVEDVPEEVADHSADMEAIDVVDEAKSIEVPVANVEDVPEEVADHSADMEAIDVVDEAKSIEVPVANVEDVPEEVADHSSSADVEAIHDDPTILHVDETKSIEVLVTNVEDVPEEVAYHSSPAADMEAIHDDILPKAEELANGKVSHDDDAFLGDSGIDDDTGSDSKSLADGQEEISCEQKRCIPTAAYNSESPRTMVDEESDEDDMDHEETEIEESDGNSDIEDEEALVDANVTEAKTTPVSSFHNASQSVVDDIQVQQMENYDGGSEALINVCVMPAEEFADTSVKITSPVPDNETITTSMPPSSPLKAQFPDQSKSSNKKQTTIPKPKVTQVSDNLNKENIVEKELEPCLRKVKKNVLDEETMQKLEGLSLRKLNQMFKELKINEKMKNKEDNKQSLGKSRPALQMLSQNSMKSEDEKLN
ncbi:hypothetical protein HRI_003092200 [Hibiscus trionum]|uniref:Uncharacterized protein n=1 Tax=Hibiscus trionum TaxID=183268 RepID=A0A9W7IF39_HIBTR|nr:hypothetical protein HRI_003092200 [Hibiscus trionum]